MTLALRHALDRLAAWREAQRRARDSGLEPVRRLPDDLAERLRAETGG